MSNSITGSIFGFPMAELLSESQVNLNTIKKPFDVLRTKWQNDLDRNFYNIFEGLDDLCQNGDKIASLVINEAVNEAIKALVKYQIYEISEDTFFQEHMTSFSWNKDFSVITLKLEEIIEDTAQLDAYRTLRRQSRDRYVGYDAASEGIAIAKNLSSNVGHGLFNMMAKGVTAVGNSIKKEQIFKDSDTKHHYIESIDKIIQSAYIATVDAINEINGEVLHEYTNQDRRRAEALIENVLKERVPEEHRLSALIQAICVYPYNRSAYQALFAIYGNDNGSLDRIMNFLGLEDLTKDREQAFLKKLEKLPLITIDDCRANLPILQEYANKIGYEDFGHC